MKPRTAPRVSVCSVRVCSEPVQLFVSTRCVWRHYHIHLGWSYRRKDRKTSRHDSNFVPKDNNRSHETQCAYYVIPFYDQSGKEGAADSQNGGGAFSAQYIHLQEPAGVHESLGSAQGQSPAPTIYNKHQTIQMRCLPLWKCSLGAEDLAAKPLHSDRNRATHTECWVTGFLLLLGTRYHVRHWWLCNQLQKKKKKHLWTLFYLWGYWC